MNTYPIVKQNLLLEPLSSSALKLVRGIYNTYVSNDEEGAIDIKISNFFKLLNLKDSKESIDYIQDLLEEINEPIAVRNFEFRGITTQLKFVQFCIYKIKTDVISIEVSEEYLHAQSEYMLDSFLL